MDCEWFAASTHCAQDDASLSQASVMGHPLISPNPTGCHPDVRQRRDRDSDDLLHCHPVRAADDERVLVGCGIAFEPNLPGF